MKLKIEINGYDETNLVNYQGELSNWTLTNATYLKGSEATLYRFRFSPSLLNKYKLKVNILHGKKGANIYHPTIFFHGIDDGYFWLRSYVNNILTGIGVILFWVTMLLGKRIKNKNRNF